jgi:hypothetical protein
LVARGAREVQFELKFRPGFFGTVFPVLNSPDATPPRPGSGSAAALQCEAA